MLIECYPGAPGSMTHGLNEFPYSQGNRGEAVRSGGAGQGAYKTKKVPTPHFFYFKRNYSFLPNVGG